MSVAIKQETVKPPGPAATAIHLTATRAEAIRHLEQHCEQLDGGWAIYAWPAGRGFGWITARSGWVRN